MLIGFTCQKITTMYLAKNQLQGLLKFFLIEFPQNDVRFQNILIFQKKKLKPR